MLFMNKAGGFHPPVNLPPLLCQLVQAAQSPLLLPLVLPGFGGHIASELPLFQLLESLQRGGGEREDGMRRE